MISVAPGVLWDGVGGRFAGPRVILRGVGLSGRAVGQGLGREREREREREGGQRGRTERGQHRQNAATERYCRDRGGLLQDRGSYRKNVWGIIFGGST